jgi:pilin isopeptide linkage protein
MLKRVNTRKTKRVISVFLLLLFMMSVSIGDTPALAGGGVASLHMNGGTGYIFNFVFRLASGGPDQTITIPGNGTVAAIYSPSGSALAIGDQLIYVLVTDSNGIPIGTILPNAIGHRSDTGCVLQADGSMGANGQMVGNTGTINFWFNGFTSGSNVQPGASYLMANKVWINADGTPFTGTPPALSFTLNGSFTIAGNPYTVTNIPMLPGVPVLVQDGNYTITEPDLTGSGFRLVSILSTTMQPNLPNRSASVTTNNSNYSATFTNQEIPINTTLTLDGLKVGNGIPAATADVPAGIFNFSVTDQATGLIVATGTNEAGTNYGGTAYMPIDFTPIEYTAADIGQHTLIVQETGTTDPTWFIDNISQFEVMVNVSLSGNNVVANAAYMGNIEFHNYNNARGSFQPAATKEAPGSTLEINQFTFAVRDMATGTIVSTGTNDANGNIDFSLINYNGVNDLGTHTYTVFETSPNVNGWTLMNPGPYTITVNVAEDPSDPAGPLIVTPAYPNGTETSNINFINVYMSHGFLSLAAQKTAVGGTLQAGQFQFAVVDNNGNTIASGSNDANGNVVFSTINYNSYTPGDVGFHRYSIIETSPSAGGWTTSSVVYPLLVSVADNGNGTMTVQAFTILRSDFTFTNIYGSSGSVTLAATKTTNGGGTLAAGQFEFAVQDEFGVTVATGVNDAAGNITFTPIDYTNNDVGTHNYTILETSAGGNGWTTSSVVYNVSVRVVDNGNGTITATPIYPIGGVIFVNTYGASGSIALSAIKSTTGSTVAAAAGMFNFAIMDANGVIVSTGTNDANGDILFSAIPYTLADVGTPQNYTIVEKDTGSVNWQTDSTVYNVTVNVTDNGDGTLTATQISPDPLSDIVFTNTFIPPPSGTLVISKAFTGLPAGFNVFNPANISPISFLVVGQQNPEVYRLTVMFNRANFSWNPSTGTFDCVLPGLPLGTYTVTESGGQTPGYDLNISMPLPSVSLTETGATFNIIDNYTPTPVTPVNHPSMTINKNFHGLTVAERPANFQIVITGPGGFSETLSLDQAMSGTDGTFTDLAAGAYTIDEQNSSVSGFNMTVNINNSAVTLPYTIQIDDTMTQVSITIDNYYTPIPPPTDNLTIAKAFAGLPAGFDVLDPNNNMSTVSFLVVGIDSNNTEVYRQTILFNSANFTWNSGTRTFNCLLSNLPLATYTVTESGGNIPGYIQSVSYLPPVASTPTDITFNVTNNYTIIPTPPVIQPPVIQPPIIPPVTPPPVVQPTPAPSLTINKNFHGLTVNERPANFQIIVTGPNNYSQTLSLNQVISGTGGILTNLAAGAYTIDEVNSSVSGFNMSVNVNNNTATLPYTVTITDTMTGNTTIIIDNYYTPIPPPSDNLTISKAFTGLPGNFNVFDQNSISPISFLVVGTDSANTEIFRQSVLFSNTNFTWNPATGTFDCILTNLPVATYNVYESGGHVPGYELSVSPLPPLASNTTSSAFTLTNNYSPTPVTPAVHPALTINKAFHGLTPAERPGNFQITITGPGAFNQSLNLNQAVSGGGGTFTNLAAGTYTINEINSNIPGFSTSVSINNRTVTLPYTVQITNGHITVTIDNTYTPRPPASPPPAPSTGISRNIVLPLLIFTLGTICIAGAEAYRRRCRQK